MPKRPLFDDGTDDRRGSRRGSRTNPRKTLQLCSQVRRALDLALASGDMDELLLDVRVRSVEPTADESRLQVIFEAGGDAAAAGRGAVHACLELARPRFLREVAEAISRRKIPDLAFEVVREGAIDGA